MKDLKLNPKEIPAILKRKLIKLVPFIPYIFIVVVVCAFSYMLLSIKSLANKEPTEEAISEKLLQIKQPKVDQTVVNTLQELKDQNVQVQSLFEQARDNPFEN